MPFNPQEGDPIPPRPRTDPRMNLYDSSGTPKEFQGITDKTWLDKHPWMTPMLVLGAGLGASAFGGGAAGGEAGAGSAAEGTGSSSVMNWINRGRQGMGVMNMFNRGNQAPGNDSGGGMSGVRGQAPSSIFEAAPNLMGTDPNLYNANAEDLKKKGRYGDSELLHVSKDELSQLKSTGKVTQNPSTGLPEAFSFGDFAGPIGNIIGRNQTNQDLSGIAGQASNASNPLAAPQRQQYQTQLSNMFTPQGAQNFMQNDPSIQAQRQMIGDQMQSSFGKSGNMPLTGIMGSAQLANSFGGQYNQRIQDLGMLGGFNQGNPYGGMPYTAMMQPRQQGNASVMGSMGPFLNSVGGWAGRLFGGSGGGGGSGGFNDFTGGWD